jgi:uncharacterized protein with von Willebrand factor type A (vWA) domain
MTAVPAPEEDGGGKLAENILHFGRTLRAAGMPVGPGRVIEALRAVEATGVQRRDDFYWALHAVFVNRRDQRELFDQAFHIFWRNPRLLERMLATLLPQTRFGGEHETNDVSRRVADALFPGMSDDAQASRQEVEVDATLTYSANESLGAKDFDSMSAAEIAEAKAAIARIRLPIERISTRRFAADPRGPRIDMRSTLRSALRTGGGTIPLRRRARNRRPPPLVIICDISGSMRQYSRMLLHFVHAITSDRDRVHTFLFGTRLTNITRFLRYRDVDVALKKVGEGVVDWSGGTRIGACLKHFNTHWSRRVLGQGAMVLLISDGLDRDAAEGLEVEIDRLHRSCRRLIWLNPLLSYEQFEPKSLGVATILRHVDEFRPVHNINSLRDLAQALGGASQKREEAWKMPGKWAA